MTAAPITPAAAQKTPFIEYAVGSAPAVLLEAVAVADTLEDSPAALAVAAGTLESAVTAV